MTNRDFEEQTAHFGANLKERSKVSWAELVGISAAIAATVIGIVL